jgi:exopolysaccharide biosynthesis WecB/TagA/CpsF family protein
VPPAILVDSVRRERLMADRSGRPCSVAAFKVDGGVRRDTMRVAWSVLRAARASDVVGTLDDSTVCAVLPETGAEGVSAFCAAVELDPAVTTVTYWWTHTPGQKGDQPTIETKDLLPWFVAGFESASARSGIRSIATKSQTLARVRYEKARADRSKRPLTVAVIRATRRVSVAGSLRAVRTLLARKRRTDFVGRLGDRSVCLLLPDTNESGARHLAAEILKAGAAVGSVDVHVYPSGWFSDLLLEQEEAVDQTAASKVVPVSDRSESVQIVLTPPGTTRSRATVWPPKFDLFGVEVSATDYDETVNVVLAAAHRRESALVTFLPVHGIVTAAGDPNYLYRVNAFDLAAPDGMPVRWAMNFLHKLKMPDRVCGPEAMTRICRRAAQDGIGIYLYGSTVDTLDGLKRNLTATHPELRIVGTDSPPFRELTEEERGQAVQRINDSGAGLVFIGLGCPRQDFFAYHNRNQIRAVQLCVGAAFDFHAGMLKRPPKWMQKWGLEWTYRLTQEPRRLWRRYLVTNTTFCWKMARRLIRGR